MKTASLANVKNKLSEYIARVVVTGEHVVITKRDKPVAALVNLRDFAAMNTRGEIEGLASAVGKWKAFDEVEGDIRKAYKSRGKDAGRKISL